MKFSYHSFIATLIAAILIGAGFMPTALFAQAVNPAGTTGYSGTWTFSVTVQWDEYAAF